MKKFITEKENKESVESNYVSKHITQVFTISSMDDGNFTEELRHRPMLIVFPPQCEGPMSHQTMAEDQVVHTGEDSSEFDSDSRKYSNGSEQLKVSI